MERFEETPRVFAEIETMQNYDQGSHVEANLRTGVPGEAFSDVLFDPYRHNPTSINVLSPMGIALGENFVTEVLPFRPLHVRIVHDLTERSELDRISKVKRDAAKFIISCLTESVEDGVGNMAYLHVVGPDDLEATDADIFDDAPDRQQFAEASTHYDFPYYTMMVSDFANTSFEAGSLENVVAIKVNHLLERRISEPMGPLVIEGGQIVNTDKHKVRELLTEERKVLHNKKVFELEEAGAVVVAIEVDPKNKPPYGIDMQEADHLIADAIYAVANQA